ISVDHALVQVGGAQSPDPAGELDVVAVVQLGKMVEAARLHRERQAILAAVVRDGEEAFLDVDIRGAVLAHRAQLDEVGRWGIVLIGIRLWVPHSRSQRRRTRLSMPTTSCPAEERWRAVAQPR